MRLCLFLISLTWLMHSAPAQKKIVFDTSKIEARHFVSGSLDKYRSDRDFSYDRFTEPPRSIWDRFWDWFWAKFGEIFNTNRGKQIFNTVIILAAIAILVFFILKVSGMTNMGLFGKKNKGERLGHSLLNDNIHTIDFDTAIQQAVEAGNFRFAVRLLYLQSLKNLTDRQLISWQINKTNIAYVHELSDKHYQQPFRELTSQFEINWYGDRPIEATEFSRVRNQFDVFNSQLPTP